MSMFGLGLPKYVGLYWSRNAHIAWKVQQKTPPKKHTLLLLLHYYTTHAPTQYLAQIGETEHAHVENI